MRTYIPGDICPHNVRTKSAQHLTKYMSHEGDVVRTYISRDIMSALYPSSFFSSVCDAIEPNDSSVPETIYRIVLMESINLLAAILIVTQSLQLSQFA